MKVLNGTDSVTGRIVSPVRQIMLRLLPVLAASLLINGVGLGKASAQVRAPGGAPSSQESATHSGQTYAPVGNSGYVVPIPEIKMGRIIGEKPREVAPVIPKAEEPAQEPTTPTIPPEPAPAPTTSTKPPEPPETAEVQEPQEPIRLPFGPARRLPEPAPTSEQSVAREAPPDQAEQDKPPFLAPPAAPDDVMEAPLPRKEVLGKKHALTIPGLLESAPPKESLKPLHLKAGEALGLPGPDERIPLGTRGEPEVIPPIVREEPPSAPVSIPETKPVDVPKEATPTLVRPGPEQKPTPVEPFVPTPKETLQSPLDPEAGDTAEVQHYLRETAPILEEMSLLMTRAPTMSIGDFDPSEPNAPIFPKDLHLKMDSMKRDLQILDSKTFAIMPPKKYERFHVLIRDSITQTHQACDAIVDYIAEPTEGNLRAVQEHLHKAKELIRKTRQGRA